MRYILLGTLSPEWALKQTERTNKARGKLEKLGIKVESIHYTPRDITISSISSMRPIPKRC
jgi:uncharacterized protein with GYD domain